MTPAEIILLKLDEKLNAPVELTLFGRAALQLGFENPPAEYALSKDVDAVLWLGQAEELAANTNFWEAIESVNSELSDQELYISHLFTEDQVILRSEWRQHRLRISGPWKKIALYRLGDLDLWLSKLMRDDPLDRLDLDFIVERAHLSRESIAEALRAARIPDVPEIREQFEICSKPFR